MLLALAAAAAPVIAKVAAPAIATGALSGLASSAAQKLVRRGQGLYLKKGGCVCEITADPTGQGLYLKSSRGLGTVGDGLYLKSGGKLINIDIAEALKQVPILKALF